MHLDARIQTFQVIFVAAYGVPVVFSGHCNCEFDCWYVDKFDEFCCFLWEFGDRKAVVEQFEPLHRKKTT